MIFFQATSSKSNGGEKQAAVETHFIKFSSKLMRQFDVAGNYYSETVRCDGNVFPLKQGVGVGGEIPL